MANDIFFKIGAIKGESADAKHKDEIEVLSWSFGVSQSGSIHAGGGGGAGKAVLNDLVIVKRVDSASPPLFLACCTGEHVPNAVLSARRVGKGNLEYFTITLEDVLVSSVTMSGGEAEDAETVGVSFRKVTISYTPQGKTGKAGAPITAGFDASSNTKL